MRFKYGNAYQMAHIGADNKMTFIHIRWEEWDLKKSERGQTDSRQQLASWVSAMKMKCKSGSKVSRPGMQMGTVNQSQEKTVSGFPGTLDLARQILALTSW